MQTFISKYGTAAHLAFLAVAPLFLYPFCSGHSIALTLLWMSLLAGVWVFIEPSRRSDEMLHDARERVLCAVFHDPLMWIMILLTVIAGIRWANGGVGMVYDAELASWKISEPALRFFPASAKGAGELPFAVSVALTVLLAGCRHALGKSARISFLAISSFMAATGAVAAATAFACGNEGAVAASKCDVRTASYVGSAYGLYFLGGIVAIVGAFECRWNKLLLVFAFAVGGSATGLYFFAPVPVIFAYLVAGLVLLVASGGYAGWTQSGSIPFKCLAAMILASLIPVLCVMGFASAELNETRFSVFGEGGTLFSSGFFPLREKLSEIAAQVWNDHPWVGTGVGAFPLDVRFNATESDWSMIATGQASAINGWWQLLAERGITGAMAFVLVLVALLCTFIRRLCGAFGRSFFLPACILGPVALLVVAAETFVDASFLRPDVMLAVGAFFALAGSSFPPVKKAAESETNKVE